MLIDCSYFTRGSRHILNATLGTESISNHNSVEVNEAIETYIGENQERFLRRMLGGSVGNRVNAYLVCIEDDEEPKRSETMDALCERLRESFADYVFFHILRDANTQSTITGLVRLKCANEYVAPLRRQVTVWNTMVERNRLFATWVASGECKVSGISVNEDMLCKINIFNL